ncbi:AAA family ATPase [Microcoleus sp. D3_18_C4]|uniref:AAA family ATPase n=1 Tax=Microcoleus sp. D3_18_C4 TaxID=3055335 RepID=UPI002FD65824
MITLTNYKITAQIHESFNSLVYRGIQLEGETPVMLKVLKADYPTPAQLTRYKQEYEINRSLNIDGVAKVYSLENYQNTLVMSLEDFGGSSLSILITEHKFSLLQFLEMAVNITAILGEIHATNIIHKDINPSNIVLNPETGQVKIIDFGLSTVLTRESTTLKNPNVLEGTLAYMSPEQTGRMNRSLDYRTDFYSLGATFYELLTHQLPFESTDALELVHYHIAKQPTPPHQINPEIPKVVSDLVMKLLAKTAEQRYQSAWGIKADLEECLTQLQSFGSISEFPLGRQDILDKFQISQKLYGREQEVETLLAAFERVAGENIEVASSGKRAVEMMLVAGYSGIGKSSLVQEIYKPITKQKGYFISGKFEQYQRNIPYWAAIKAFQELVRQLLTETESQLEQWKEKINAALGENGGIIVEVIPEVEMIAGKQPEVVSLPPAEAQNRFNFVFQKFIRVFAQKEHPLVMFIDDLQWADGASLKLMQLLMTAAESEYLFFLGAYRDNEVSPSHPLMITIDEIRKNGTTVNSIRISALKEVHINQLIVDTLKCERERSLPLTKLVIAKTQGNPFFVNEFLKSMYAEKLLTFNIQQVSWQWNLEQIKERGFTDNVVELMAGKITKLPEATQEVLKVAACIGNQFDLKILANSIENSLTEVALSLRNATVEGLIVPLSDTYKSVELEVTPLDLKAELIVEYKFIHDRVQQAAYSLIPDRQKSLVHQQVGRSLLQNTPFSQREEKIFDIVNQLNFDPQLIDNQSEKNELAELNAIAGQKALASAAYESAFKYLTFGIELLAEASWQTDYNLTVKLYAEAAKAAQLVGEFDRMENLAAVALQQAKTLLDSAGIYETKIAALTTQSRRVELVKLGIDVLKLLGVDLPEAPNLSDIQQAMATTNAALSGRKIEDLIDLPLMVEPAPQAAMRILSSLFAPAYQVAPALLPLIACQMVNLSIKYGNTNNSPFGYAGLGVILNGGFQDMESSYQYGQLAMRVLQQLNFVEVKAKTFHLVAGFTIHVKAHIRECFDIFLAGYQSGIVMGDFSFAGEAANVRCQYLYLSGMELVSVEREIAIYDKAMADIKQKTSIKYNRMTWQAVLNLLSPCDNPCRLDGEVCNEEAFLAECLEMGDRAGTAYVYIMQLILCYIFKDYPQALENAIKGEPYLDGLTGIFSVPNFYFYDSLNRLSLYPVAANAEKEQYLEKVVSNQEKMKVWADNAPMNFQHKYDLVAAEQARVTGDISKAMADYDCAIKGARKGLYTQEEAISYERAAEFYLALGREEIGEIYMKKAHYCYQLWGAKHKLQHLEKAYPYLQPRTSESTTRTTLSSRTTSGSNSSQVLDFATVMRAAQAISGEIVLEKLLSKLIKLAIENAGAQKGFLLLFDRGELKIEAALEIANNEVSVLQSVPISHSNLLPITVVNYVTRTQLDVVLNDAVNEGLFTKDPYVLENSPKSISCNAILNQGKLIGILYLENNLATSAFTTDRLEVLKIISSQAAISLENALLYQTLEQKVEERTAQLAEANSHLAEANQEITVLNERLKADNIRMSAELDVTRRLQKMLLPREQELSQVEGLEIAGFMEPADEVGGDYYDVLQHNGSVKIGIGDVTGHGLESGVLMIMAQTAIRTLLTNNEADPVNFLNIVNRTLFDNATRMSCEKNMTLALLDYQDNILRLSGQHEEVIIVRADGEVEQIDTMDLGFIIALEPDIADFVSSTDIELHSGDVVVLYTDGITEAFDMDREQYGLERLIEVVCECREESAEAIKEAAIADVRRHIGKQKVYDDITIVVIKQK